MQGTSDRTSPSEGYPFAARWLVILFIAIVIVVLGGEDAPLSAYSTPLLLTICANLILWAVLRSRLGDNPAPAVVVLDVLTVALFAFGGTSDARVTMAVSMVIMISTLMRPDFLWNAIQIAGVVTIEAMAAGRTTSTGAEVSDQLTVMILYGGALLIAAYVLDSTHGVMRRRVVKLSETQKEYALDKREYTLAISELTYTLSAHLNYQKVLEAALGAGRLGLRVPEREGSGLMSAVFLFHSEDNQLHMALSRRFPRADEGKTLAGKEGLIAKTLKEATPMFGSDVRKDPELGYFLGLQYCKSLLCIPLRAGFDNFGVLIYGSERPNAFTQDHIEVLTMIGIQTTIALQNALLYHNLLIEKERIIDAEEEARKKLARDLHDGPIQGVAAIAMRAGYIAKLSTKQPAQVPDEIKKLEELARQTTKEMRHMLFILRPLVLETQGLRAALNQLAEKMMEMHKQAIAIRIDRQIETALDRQQQDVIFYIAEEAANNARKHAEASLISISVSGEGGMAIVEIADNGKGFDVDTISGSYENRGSLGLINMQERAEMLDGTLSVSSAPGKGTKITIVFPLYLSEAMRLVQANGTTKLALAAAARVERTGEL
ncbi:MAG: GAF domain-containing sensor histidine kinase [Anaerolinea sp.]|nr:GAF domain-containing sensor histidine kinase [Anaerolinea sp.]